MIAWFKENGLFYLLLILFALFIFACAGAASDEMRVGANNQLDIVDEDTGMMAYTSSGKNGNVNYTVIVDKETGMQYLLFLYNNEPILIPRFDENGLYKTPE